MKKIDFLEQVSFSQYGSSIPVYSAQLNVLRIGTIDQKCHLNWHCVYLKIEFICGIPAIVLIFACPVIFI